MLGLYFRAETKVPPKLSLNGAPQLPSYSLTEIFALIFVAPRSSTGRCDGVISAGKIDSRRDACSVSWPAASGRNSKSYVSPTASVCCAYRSLSGRKIGAVLCDRSPFHRRTGSLQTDVYRRVVRHHINDAQPVCLSRAERTQIRVGVAVFDGWAGGCPRGSKSRGGAWDGPREWR